MLLPVDAPPTECIHRSGDCQSIAPGVMQCQCGQLYFFISNGSVGRYKKLEDITDADCKHFDPEMEKQFLEFTGRLTHDHSHDLR